MLKDTPTYLKPVSRIRLTTLNASSFTGKPRVPLMYNDATQKVAPQFVLNSQDHELPAPLVFHLEIPAGAQCLIRLHLRSLPLIHYYVRGRAGHVPLGFSVATTTTKFMGDSDSGDIVMMASSSSGDTYQFPPIDVAVPVSSNPAIIQIIYYALPLPLDIIEVFSDHGRSCELGTAYKTPDFQTIEPGIIVAGGAYQLDNRYHEFIDKQCAQLLLDNSSNSTFQFAMVTATTWTYSTFVNLKIYDDMGTPTAVPTQGIRFDDFNDQFSVRATPFHTGICHYTVPGV